MPVSARGQQGLDSSLAWDLQRDRSLTAIEGRREPGLHECPCTRLAPLPHTPNHAPCKDPKAETPPSPPGDTTSSIYSINGLLDHRRERAHAVMT